MNLSSMSYVLAKNVITRRNQDGTVILMQADQSNMFYKIDGIAAAVFNELTNPVTPQALIQDFSKRYPNYHAKIEQDIPALLAQLEQRNLISRI